MVKIIVTRHAAVVAWLEKNGIVGDVIDHVTNAEQVIGCHVYGNLPTHLQAVCGLFSVVEIPNLPKGRRGDELSVTEMEDFGARLVTYSPPRIMPETAPETVWEEGEETVKRVFTIHPSTFDEECGEVWYVLIDHDLGEISMIGDRKNLAGIYDDVRNALEFGIEREVITRYHPWCDWMVGYDEALDTMRNGGFPMETAARWLDRAVGEIETAPQWEGGNFHKSELMRWIAEKKRSSIGMDEIAEIARDYEKFAGLNISDLKGRLARRFESPRYGMGVNPRHQSVNFSEALKIIDYASRWGLNDEDNEVVQSPKATQPTQPLPKKGEKQGAKPRTLVAYDRAPDAGAMIQELDYDHPDHPIRWAVVTGCGKSWYCHDNSAGDPSLEGSMVCYAYYRWATDEEVAQHEETAAAEKSRKNRIRELTRMLADGEKISHRPDGLTVLWTDGGDLEELVGIVNGNGVMITEEHARQFDAIPYVRCNVLTGGEAVARELAELLSGK